MLAKAKNKEISIYNFNENVIEANNFLKDYNLLIKAVEVDRIQYYNIYNTENKYLNTVRKNDYILFLFKDKKFSNIIVMNSKEFNNHYSIYKGDNYDFCC